MMLALEKAADQESIDAIELAWSGRLEQLPKIADEIDVFICCVRKIV
jgi:hypothetical protein